MKTLLATVACSCGAGTVCLYYAVGEYWVRCESCELETSLCTTEQEAMAEWDVKRHAVLYGKYTR